MNAARRTPSFWPTPLQRALLQVALGPAERARARWEELGPPDVTALPQGAFPLMPLLYERLAEVAPDEPQLSRLLGTYRRTWYRNQLLLRRLGLLLRLLREREVESLLAGAAAGLLRWHPRLGSRPVVEIELLAEPGAGAEAVAAAAELGWEPSPSGRRARLVDADGFILVVHDGAPPVVAGPLGADGGYRSLRARAVELDRVESRPLVLDPVDELLFLCAGGARTMLPPNCQWLVDVHRLVRSTRLPEVDAVIARAHRLHLVEPLRETMTCLADLLGAEPVAELLAALHAQPASRRDRAAFRLGTVASPRLVAPAQLLADHLHATAEESFVHALAGLPAHLQQRWAAIQAPPPPGRSSSASS